MAFNPLSPGRNPVSENRNGDNKWNKRLYEKKKCSQNEDKKPSIAIRGKHKKHEFIKSYSRKIPI